MAIKEIVQQYVSNAYLTIILLLVIYLLVSVAVTTYYKHPQETTSYITFAVAAGLTFSLCLATIFPLDVYFVSSTCNSSRGEKYGWVSDELIEEVMLMFKWLYYGGYSIVIGLCFVALPFIYWFYEEDDDQSSLRQRLANALQYTLIGCVILVLAVLIGFLLLPSPAPPNLKWDWVRHILATTTVERLLTFVVASLTLLGMLQVLIYTAYGLAALPAKLLVGGRGTGSRAIHWSISRPLEIACGTCFTTFTLLLLVSMLVTCVDRSANAICGEECGFLLSYPHLFNPLNQMLSVLSSAFPLDYGLVVALTCYLLLATLSGVGQLDLRFAWTRLFSVRRRATAPQGLLILVGLLMLALVAINYNMATAITPQYAQFGSQTYCNHTVSGRRDCSAYPHEVLPCDLSAPMRLCTPTMLSTIVHRINFSLPAVATLLLGTQWLFVLVVLASLVFLLVNGSTAIGERDRDIARAPLVDTCANGRSRSERLNSRFGAVA